jgi:hypothetical protein
MSTNPSVTTTRQLRSFVHSWNIPLPLIILILNWILPPVVPCVGELDHYSLEMQQTIEDMINMESDSLQSTEPDRCDDTTLRMRADWWHSYLVKGCSLPQLCSSEHCSRFGPEG